MFDYISFFSELDESEKQLLRSVLQERHFQPGGCICTEGDDGGSCFILVEGSVQVLKRIAGNKHQVIALIKQGDLFGHIALIDGQNRSATCRAMDQVVVFELDRDNFDHLFASESVFAYKIQDEIASAVGRQVLKASAYLTSLMT